MTMDAITKGLWGFGVDLLAVDRLLSRDFESHDMIQAVASLEWKCFGLMALAKSGRVNLKIEAATLERCLLPGHKPEYETDGITE